VTIIAESQNAGVEVWFSPARVTASASRAIQAIRKNSSGHFPRSGSGRSFGEDVAEFLAAAKFAGQVIIHSANPFGAEIMLNELYAARIKAEIVPFTLLGIVRAQNDTNSSNEQIVHSEDDSGQTHETQNSQDNQRSTRRNNTAAP
jgi:hypothetical protein